MVLWHILFWAILTVVLVGSEIITVQLVSVWFGAGSLVAFISAFFGIEFYMQVIIFIAVSIILLLATRPFVKRFLSKGHVTTNADSVVGKKCVVREEVNNLKGTGRVFVDGLDWAAKSKSNDSVYEVGAACSIAEIQGVTLLVEDVRS